MTEDKIPESAQYEEYEHKEGHEFCIHCGWVNKDDEELPQDEAFESFHPICPKCMKTWGFDFKVIKTTFMVQMTKAYFDGVRRQETD